MSPQKIIAVLLLIVGMLALVYGGFSYTGQTHRMDIGSMHLSLGERHHVNVPVWAGIAALVVGGILLLPRRS